MWVCLGLAAGLCLLAACAGGRGYVHSDGEIADGESQMRDAREAGEVPDATPITPIVCQNDCRDFVVTRLILPDTTTGPKYGLDLTGDGKVDNALGSILGTLSSVGSLSLQQDMDESTYGGGTVMLIRVQSSSFVSAAQAKAQAWRGANQKCCTDPNSLTACKSEAAKTCHSGSYSFAVHATTPNEARFLGVIAASVMSFGPSAMKLTLALPGGGTVDLEVRSVRLKGTIGASGITEGIIAGALTKSEIDSKLMPAFVTLLNATLSDASTSTSTKSTILSLFDANKDGKIDLSELTGNALLKMLFAGDVDLDHDGQKELSLGLGLEAVGATIQK